MRRILMLLCFALSVSGCAGNPNQPAGDDYKIFCYGILSSGGTDIKAVKQTDKFYIESGKNITIETDTARKSFTFNATGTLSTKWDDVEGKPAVFPSSIPSVANLQAALNAKANTGDSYLKADDDSKFALKADKSDLTPYLVKSATNGLNTVASINNGVLKIDAEGGGGGIPDAPTDGKLYGRQNLIWNPIDLSSYASSSWVNNTFQPKGTYVIPSDIKDMATQAWVGQQNFATQSWCNGQFQYASNMKDYEKISSLASDILGCLASNSFHNKADNDSYYQYKGNYLVSADLVPYAKKTDLPDISDMATKTFTSATYQPKTNMSLYEQVSYLSNDVKNVCDPIYQPKGSYLTSTDIAPFKIKDIKAGNNVTVTSDSGTYTINSMGGGGSGAVWGQITGTLKDQKDLQTALDGKMSFVSGNDLFMYRGSIAQNSSMNSLNAMGTWYGYSTCDYTNIPTALKNKAFILMCDINTGATGSPNYIRQTISGFAQDVFYSRIGNLATNVWGEWVMGTMYPIFSPVISIYDARYGYKKGDDLGAVLKKINDDESITTTSNSRCVWFPDDYYQIKNSFTFNKDFTFMSSGSSDCNIQNIANTTFNTLTLIGINYYDFYQSSGATYISGNRLTGDRCNIGFNNGGGTNKDCVINLDNSALSISVKDKYVCNIVGDVHIGRDGYSPAQTIIINGTTVNIWDYLVMSKALNLQKLATITVDATTCDITVDSGIAPDIGSPLLTDIDISATTGKLNIRNYNNGALNKGVDWDIQNCGKINVILDNTITRQNAYTECYGDMWLTLKNNSRMEALSVSGNLILDCDNTSSSRSISVMGKLNLSSFRTLDMIDGNLTCDELVLSKDTTLNSTAETTFSISQITGSKYSLGLQNVFLTSDTICVKSLIVNKTVTSSNPSLVAMEVSCKGGNLSSNTDGIALTVPIYIASLDMSSKAANANTIKAPLKVIDQNWKLPNTIGE